MLVGSFASTAFGAARSTQDIDVVIDPSPEALDTFLSALGRKAIYVDPTAPAALARRDQFNVIDSRTGWKVDLIIRKNRPFSHTEFDRRMATTVMGVRVHVATRRTFRPDRSVRPRPGGSASLTATGGPSTRVSAGSTGQQARVARWLQRAA